MKSKFAILIFVTFLITSFIFGYLAINQKSKKSNNKKTTTQNVSNTGSNITNTNINTPIPKIIIEKKVDCLLTTAKDCLKSSVVWQDLNKILEEFGQVETAQTVNESVTGGQISLQKSTQNNNKDYKLVWTCANCKTEELKILNEFTHIPTMQNIEIDNTNLAPIISWQSNFSALGRSVGSINSVDSLNKVDGSSNINLSQKAYSVEYIQNSKTFYKSGRINATNNAVTFVPITKPSGETFKLNLQIWFLFKNIELPVQKLSKEFSFKFQLPDLSNISKNDTYKIQQKAWIPDWDLQSALKSLQNANNSGNSNIIWTEVNPFYYTVNEDGTLKSTQITNNAQLKSICVSKNIKIVPTIFLFDADILTKVLNKNLDKHVNNILSSVDKNNYSGIDLDYESTYLKDKDLFIQFLTKLSKGLHDRNKTLSFTAVSKWSDQNTYSFLPQTHQVQQWDKIADLVDEFRVMAYDFTGQSDVRNGPLSPIIWDEMIIQYALSKMSEDKFILSLPLYSHSWPNLNYDPAGKNNDTETITDKKQTISFTHQQIVNVKKRPKYTEILDTWNLEKKSTYYYEKKNWTMFYLDKTAIEYRLKLASKYHIRGVAYWRLGGEIL